MAGIGKYARRGRVGGRVNDEISPLGGLRYFVRHDGKEIFFRLSRRFLWLIYRVHFLAASGKVRQWNYDVTFHRPLATLHCFGGPPFECFSHEKIVARD